MSKKIKNPPDLNLFPQEAAERVAAVQRALKVGYSLAELSEIFQARDSGAAPCKRTYALAQEKLVKVRGEIEGLKQTEKYLSRMLLDWKKRMRKTPAGGRAFLLSSMQEMSGPAMPFKNSLRRKK